MEWQPIETYDKLKKKPRRAVFWFEGTLLSNRGQVGKYNLEPCPNFSRVMGSRICTHWMPLPEAPKE